MSDISIDLKNAALLIIDMQQAFDAPHFARDNPDLDRNGLALLAAWRKAGKPICHIRHDSVEPASLLRPGEPGNAFRPGFEPGSEEHLVAKSVNSALIGTDLDLWLRRNGIITVVMIGISADRCVSTTARMASNMNYRVVIMAEGVCSLAVADREGNMIPAREVTRVHLATLADEFATVASRDEIIANLQ
jgi:nicotinamidase-related amidase